VGTLSLRTLLLAAPEAPIEQIMESDLVTVEPDAAAEDVAATIARYDLLACPVVDERGKMLGIVTVDDAIDAIMPPRLAKRLPRFTAHHHRKSPEPAAT
ncbi:MAG: CBS domain-containing protein, partial [Candidatus Eremiobacteraeota bacterium]|nr:CBS domain-containing protein [Candidatus Eremiobacteraeota bacterium]